VTRFAFALITTRKRKALLATQGLLQGFTLPSQTGVEVVGDSTEDYAIAFMIKGRNSTMWFAANLLEFLNHQPGTTVEIGSKRLIRDETGGSHEAKLP